MFNKEYHYLQLVRFILVRKVVLIAVIPSPLALMFAAAAKAFLWDCYAGSSVLLNKKAQPMSIREQRNPTINS